MRHITSTQNNNVTFILLPHNYTGLHNKLKLLIPEFYSFFAKPKVTARHTNWYWDNKSSGNESPIIKSYLQLNEEERIFASDYIENIKPQIIEALSNDPELGGLAQAFFTIPLEEDIKLVSAGSEKTVVLTQWGCKLNNVISESDPVATVINIPKPNREEVVIYVKYKDGSNAASKLIYFDYQGIINNGVTDEEGVINIGKFKYGSKIEVYDIVNESKTSISSLIVNAGKSYEVYFPLFTEGILQVIDQKKNKVSDYALSFHNSKNSWTGHSDESGVINLKGIEVGEELKVKDPAGSNSQKNFPVGKEGNEFVFEIYQPYYTSAHIKVIDQFDRIVPETGLILEHEVDNQRISKEAWSDENGLVFIDKIREGVELNVKQKDNTSNYETYLIKDIENRFNFKIEIPVPRTLKFKILDDRKKPARNEKIKINHKGKEYDLITDNKGYAEISSYDIQDGDQISLLMRIGKKRNVRKLKLLKKS